MNQPKQLLAPAANAQSIDTETVVPWIYEVLVRVKVVNLVVQMLSFRPVLEPSFKGILGGTAGF